METINQELEQKSIERPKDVDFATGEQVIEGGVVNKPKKPRTQAQKEAFERARKKRAENLAKKKELEEAVDSKSISEETPAITEQVVEKTPNPPQEKKPVKRGRPKGARNKTTMKREPEPQPAPPQPHQPAPVYLDYPLPHNPRYPQYYHPPPMMYQQPPPTPQPVNNNYYYYGTPPPDPQLYHPQKEEDYVEVEDGLSSTDEDIPYVNDIQQLPPQPQLKYRFA